MIRRTILAVVSWLAITAAADAHKLELAYQLLPGWRVQVRGWYEGGDPASGARVRIVQEDGQTQSEGRLDKYGIYTFSFTATNAVKIIVSITGHRAEETIPAEALNRHLLACCAACLTPQLLQSAALLELHASGVGEIGRHEVTSDLPAQFPWIGLLIGVGTLLIVAVVFKRLSKRKPA
jgi:hypothetical protein